MRKHGLPTLTARNTAMIEAVADLPPIVVSDLFGIHASTAHMWGQLANDSWAQYLAACDSKPSSRKSGTTVKRPPEPGRTIV